MQAAIVENLGELATLCRMYGVRRLEVFGSAARANDFKLESSDADFLVEFDETSRLDPLGAFFGLQAALSDLLKRPVDLVESAAIKNPYLRKALGSDRWLVYAA